MPALLRAFSCAVYVFFPYRMSSSSFPPGTSEHSVDLSHTLRRLEELPRGWDRPFLTPPALSMWTLNKRSIVPIFNTWIATESNGFSVMESARFYWEWWSAFGNSAKICSGIDLLDGIHVRCSTISIMAQNYSLLIRTHLFPPKK